MNAGILPAFAATIDALNNKKFNFKSYANLVHKDLEAMQNSQSINLIKEK